MQDASRKPKIVDSDESGVVVRPAAGPAAPASGQEPRQVTIPSEIAVLPVRNVVVFPGMVLPLSIGRERSKRLIDSVLPEQKVIGTVCQKDPGVEEPRPEDLFEVGSSVAVLKLLQMDEGQQSIIIHGLARIRITEWLASDPYLRARVEVLQEKAEKDTETEALMHNARNLASRVVQLSSNIPDEAETVLRNIDEPGPLADFLASNLQIDVAARQKLLEELDVNERLRRTSVELQRQIEVLEMSNKIQSEVQANIDKSQREYYLRQQLEAIRKELGETDEKTAEVQELRNRIDSSEMPQYAREEALRDVARLENIPMASPEYNVLRTYLDTLVELPWTEATQDKLDIDRARKVLDEDHYDLEKVKKRILEFLAVRKLAPESRGPILCFVGPPGVGKTSLGQSIARALGRKFIRMSLGGLRDEAELRGHRRTYVGAMPGRILQEIRKAGVRNPVFMLDELDKVGQDFRGDPTSALLEILDPAQNDNFRDNYLNMPFDLSKVLFIGTANTSAPIPPALRDRLETIDLPGYTEQEKLQIAMKYLVPRQLKENGLKSNQANWTEEAVVRIIREYTREAGVRELERQIGTVCRAVAAMIAAGEARSRKINPKRVREMLGAPRYENEVAMRTARPGVATGLAYTPAGGEIIFVEAAVYPGKGQLSLTGQIGDVMRESAQAALSLVKSRGEQMGVDAESLTKKDIHIHVPAGAVQKDGPSAGVAIFTALTSLLTETPVRSDVAMTGEISLRGLVLPVGGIKEKVLAARRAGINTVVLPDRNRKDLEDVPEEAKKVLNFEFKRTVDEVLDLALDRDGKTAKGKGRGKPSSKRQSGSRRRRRSNS
ncbi:MAG: endopeptidase La [Phycisphaerae bacterium]